MTKTVRMGAVFAFAAAAGLVFTACGYTISKGSTRSTRLQGAQMVPAARGVVATRVTDNGNVKFDVKVDHLAPPNEVAQGTDSYVVWLKPMDQQQPPQNMGVLGLNREKLTGDFSGVTPHKRFELMITAEQTPTATRPSDNQVMSARV